MPTTFTDEQLGLITVRMNARALRIIMRPQLDGVVVTIPPHTSQKTLVDTLNHFRQRLRTRQLEMQKKETEAGGDTSHIGPDFRIETDLLTLTLEQGNRPTFYLRKEAERMVIVCPPDTDFDSTERQQVLHRIVERVLRTRAEELLPERLRALSLLHNLPFNICKVNVSKGRWGSCSARWNINLSCYLLLLPAHLCEYVMLHELCHTREMNHGPRFWTLLDSLTGGKGKAKTLRKELQKYHTSF